jgi:hypothetical protein
MSIDSKKIPKITWSKLFNKKDFHYSKSTNKLLLKKKNISPLTLAKIIYPELTLKKFFSIKQFINTNIFNIFFNSVMDFGSGNGAFLKIFLDKNVSKIFSLEISSELLAIQKKIFKRTKKIKYIVTDNQNVHALKKIKNKSIDVVFCSSVFQYFKSNFYCKTILSEFARIAKYKIFIYDLKDEKTKSKYLIKLRKRQKLSQKEFNLKYKNTPIRFYNKQFFVNFFKKKYPNFKVNFLPLPKGATDQKFGYCIEIIPAR